MRENFGFRFEGREKDRERRLEFNLFRKRERLGFDLMRERSLGFDLMREKSLGFENIYGQF